MNLQQTGNMTPLYAAYYKTSCALDYVKAKGQQRDCTASCTACVSTYQDFCETGQSYSLPSVFLVLSIILVSGLVVVLR